MTRQAIIEWYAPHTGMKLSERGILFYHVDMSHLRAFPTEFVEGCPNEAWNILHWQEMRRKTGWAGISNIREVADYYLSNLPEAADFTAEKKWVNRVLSL